jgi:hypothetical protein
MICSVVQPLLLDNDVALCDLAQAVNLDTMRHHDR